MMPQTIETATEWARAHGTPFRWFVQLDNHEPVPRAYASGDGWFYDQDGETRAVLDNAISLRYVTRAVFLLDDGTSVRPFYVLAYHPDESHLIIGPFPTNVDRDGNQRVRADDGRPVDFSTWQLGPRRAYHLKVRGAQ